MSSFPNIFWMNYNGFCQGFIIVSAGQALEIREFVDSLAFLADLVDPVQASEPLLRDVNDQPVLGTFLAANANYLVTGDKDLLALSALYPKVTPADFWQAHGD